MKELVLVTGGAGFIGGHLVDALIARGYRVRVLDNLSPATHDGKLPKWFNKKAQFQKGDVRLKKDWEKALKGVSYIFHIAGYMDYRPDFSTYITTNTMSTALMYEVILEKKLLVKKILLASSQSVYGEGKYKCPTHGEQYSAPRDPERLKKKDWDVYCKCGKRMTPIAELEGDELFPINPYGVSKRGLEEIALTLGREYSIPTVAFRYAIVHGARQSFRNFYSGALRSFVVQALAGIPMSIHEDGNQMRDFVHIDDVVSAHMKALESSKADYNIFNIGSGRRDTVLDLAHAVAKETRSKSKPGITGMYRTYTSRNSIMDVSKLKKIGWKPRRTLTDNVRDYVAWVGKYPEALAHLRRIQKDLAKNRVVR